MSKLEKIKFTSVIITSLNDGLFISNLLKDLLDQSLANNLYEVLVLEAGNFEDAVFFKKTFYKHKIKLVLNFKSEIKRTKSLWVKRIENECIANGNIINKKYAEAFEVVKLSNAFKI